MVGKKVWNGLNIITPEFLLFWVTYDTWNTLKETTVEMLMYKQVWMGLHKQDYLIAAAKGDTLRKYNLFLS